MEVKRGEWEGEERGRERREGGRGERGMSKLAFL
jgi:hypothetical protein